MVLKAIRRLCLTPPPIPVILAQAIPPAAGQGAQVHSLLDAGFHRHDEVLLG